MPGEALWRRSHSIPNAAVRAGSDHRVDASPAGIAHELTDPGVWNVTANRDIATLAAAVGELDQQINALTDERRLLQAEIACLRQPDDARPVQRFINLLGRQNKPIPDDLQEQSLRLYLRDDPYNLETSRALIALLHRTGATIVPSPPAGPANPALPNSSSIEDLLRASEELARQGDTFQVYATMWQICARYPQTARGFAEFARCLADRGEWNNCRIAVQRVLTAGQPDEATAQATLAALSALAAAGQVSSLDWKAWLEQLPPALQVHPLALKIQSWTNNTAAMLDALPRAESAWPDNPETWIFG